MRMGSSSSSSSKDRDSGDSDSCPIILAVAARKPPDVRNPRTRKRDCLKDSDSSSGCSLKLFPEENAWHFVTLTPTRADRRVEFAINVIITGKTLAKLILSEHFHVRSTQPPTFLDCPHPTEKINYLLANKINPHEVCSEITKNTGSAIQLLFPPYQATRSDDIYKKCGQRQVDNLPTSLPCQ